MANKMFMPGGRIVRKKLGYTLWVSMDKTLLVLS